MPYAARFDPNVADSLEGSLTLVITSPEAAKDVTVKVWELDKFKGAGGDKDEGSEPDLLATFTGEIKARKFKPKGKPTLPEAKGKPPKLKLKFEGDKKVYEIPIVADEGEDEGANFEIGLSIEEAGSEKFKSDAPAFVRGTPTQYRLSIAIGDLAALCGDLTTVKGKKRALQLLDLYPEIIAAADEAKETDIYKVALEYAKHVLGGDVATKLPDALKMLVQAGDKPVSVLGDSKKSYDARLVLPNTFCITDGDVQLGADAAGVLQDHRFVLEANYHAGNDALAAFPIVVKVEFDDKGTWKPAAKTDVQVQLVDPHPKADKAGELEHRLSGFSNAVTSPPAPTATNSVPAGKTWNTPQDGPRGYMKNVLGSIVYDAKDPQGVNAYLTVGGKRQVGVGVAGHIFAKAPGGAALKSTRPLYAVTGKTDDKGELKVLFRPSKFAGDRYKIRAFVDPWDGVLCDGTQKKHPRAETGVLTVWKTIRIAGLVSKPKPDKLGRWFHGNAMGNGVVPNTSTLGAVDVNRFKTRLAGAFFMVQHDKWTKDLTRAKYEEAIQYVRANIATHLAGGSLAGAKFDMDAFLAKDRYFPTDANKKIQILDAGKAVLTLAGKTDADKGEITVAGLDPSGNFHQEKVKLDGKKAIATKKKFASFTDAFFGGAGAAPNYTVTSGSKSLDVAGNVSVSLPIIVEVSSSDASDNMAVELFGLDAAGLSLREAIRLNGTTKVASRISYNTLLGMRVVARGGGALNKGKVTVAAQGYPTWPLAELAAGAGAVNLTAVSSFESPYTFPAEMPWEYDALSKDGATTFGAALNWWDYFSLIYGCGKALAVYLTKYGTGGIVIHRALAGDMHSVFGSTTGPHTYTNGGTDGYPALPANWFPATSSGVGVYGRACHVWYSVEDYNAGFPYDLTSNTMHEVGHVLFMRHGWTIPGPPDQYQQGTLGASFPDDHDYHDVCVMAYHANDGDYCGRCLYKLAGGLLTSPQVLPNA